MSNFAPLYNPDSRVHRTQLAGAANAALRGETHNVGVLHVPAGSESVRVMDERISPGRCLLLSPLDATAAALRWWTDPATGNKGSSTVYFVTAPAADCRFVYLVAGILKYDREGA